MSPNDFNGTTSRRALILGMTNTDQIGMWQALAPQRAVSTRQEAEVLPDAGDGTDAESAGDVNELTGLSAEEQAAFDGMRTGDTPAGDPEPGAGDVDPDADADADGEDADADATGEAEPAAAAPVGKEKTPAELEAEAAAGQKPPKSINFSRHQRELKKANDAAEAARAEAKKAREDAIKLAERVAIINEALTAQPAAAVDPNAPPANPFDEADIDPAEDYAASLLQERRRNKYAYEASRGIQQDVTVSREDQHMRDTFQRDFTAMAATDPVVPLAYQFLKDSRLREICISEFDKDPFDENEEFTPQQVQRMVQIFNAEEKYVVGNAIKAGKSPTAAILRLAKARGFKPPAPPARAAAPAAVPARTNGAAPAAPAAPSAATALATLAAAKEAGKSLSDGGGAPPPTGITAKMLLDMDDDQFAAFVDEIPPHELDNLMGRVRG